jgi:hypothetical protein
MSEPSLKKEYIPEKTNIPKTVDNPEGMDGLEKANVPEKVNGAKKATVQYNQMEDIRINFKATSENHWINQKIRDFFYMMADIIKLWQGRACGNDPTDCALSFGPPEVTVTLRQVLALVPEQYQYKIVLEGASDSGSWLDENLMNVLVQLIVKDAALGAHFARCLATDCNMSLDGLSASEGYPTRLAYLRHQQEQNLSDWNVSGLYTVPADTDRIVCFWNYYENHWSVLSIDIDNEKWTYKIYNSLDCANKTTRHSVCRLGLDLGHLIRAASNIDLPPLQPVIETPSTAQQDNCHDCGVYAVDNVVCLLLRLPVPVYVDPFTRRFAFVRKILWALRDGNGVNSDFSKLSPEEQYASTKFSVSHRCIVFSSLIPNLNFLAFANILLLISKREPY